MKIGQILIGLILGAAVGAGGAWRLMNRAGEHDGHEHATHATAETHDDHDHSAGQHDHDAHEDGCSHGHGHEHGEHDEGGAVVLSEKATREAGIKIVEAGPGELEETLTLPGEIGLNADKVAHIVPRVSGIVRRVEKSLGDEVQAGEVMAVLESRELAEAKADYLAARQRLALAEANLKSAQELHQKKIMPDLEFLTIEKDKAEAAIALQAAGNKLHALGLAEDQVPQSSDPTSSLALYELRAPFAGTVVQKHCALGEVLTSETDAFVLADLSTVWATISVYAQDIGRVRPSQTVHIRADGAEMTASGEICYIAPVANEATRTVYARVDLPNTARQWRPGTFITASIVLDRKSVPVLVPIEAVQRVKGQSVVFVSDEHGFEPRPVAVGRTSSTHAEIVSGLAAGEPYVAQGAMILKAELGKRGAVHEH